MKHKAIYNVRQDCDTAVLFVHGILGTPNHFEEFIPLVPEAYSVVNLLLDGHGKGVEDFSDTSMEKWKKQVTVAVDALSETHKNIFIVAHSMGCLFAMEQALRNPRVKALFLLAVPLRLFLKPAMVSNSLRVYLGKIKPEDARGMASLNTYGVENDKRFWKYFGWIPRFLELFREIRNTRKVLIQLKTPCWCFQSCMDEMVSVKTAELLKSVDAARVWMLEKSSHFYYDPADRQYLMEQFSAFLAEKHIGGG